MHEVPIAWIRHDVRHLGADSPGALKAARRDHAFPTDEAAQVSARKFVGFLAG